MEDLTGKQFGEWTVLERDKKKYNSRGARYICECSCGTIKSVFGKNLRKGKSVSCGSLDHTDISGERYNSWTVLHRDLESDKRSMYICQCDCGTIRSVSSASLKNGKSKCCGCQRQKDLTGQKFGQLTVTSMLPVENHISYCVCDCECGTTGYVVKANSLTTGNTSSCGCIHSPNLTGRTFGRLTVVREVESDKPQRYWECHCECGSIITVDSYRLTSGHTQSCGCIRSERTSQAEVYITNYLQSNAIAYINECSFEDCIGEKGWKLRFDFFIPSYNIAIECDGIQHFKPIEFFGGEERFSRTQSNDKIKDEYCLQNNITLVRFPYYMTTNEMEEQMNEIFTNPVTTTVT